MKYLFLVLGLGALSAEAKETRTKKVVMDGVPYYCLRSAQYQLIKEAAEDGDRREELQKYKDYITGDLFYSCRDRQNPKIEYFTWCDGSGCSGVHMEREMSTCRIKETWHGQDDQDPIEDDTDSCLKDFDFRK